MYGTYCCIYIDAMGYGFQTCSNYDSGHNLFNSIGSVPFIYYLLDFAVLGLGATRELSKYSYPKMAMLSWFMFIPPCVFFPKIGNKHHEQSNNASSPAVEKCNTSLSTQKKLGGGWTNPFEKYAPQIGSFPQKGMNIRSVRKPPPSFFRRKLPPFQQHIWGFVRIFSMKFLPLLE